MRSTALLSPRLSLIALSLVCASTSLCARGQSAELSAALKPELAVTINNEVAFVAPGETLIYTIEVANRSPVDVPEAWVAMDPVQGLRDVRFTCIASPGASCAAKGLGAPSDLVRLPAGATVTYLMSARVDSPIGTALSNRITVEPMRPYHDIDVSNNEAIEQDFVVAPVRAVEAD